MSTVDTEKYTRINLMLVKSGTMLTRRLFLQSIKDLSPIGHEYTVDEFLNKHKKKILTTETGRNKRHTIYPSSGNTNLDNWDLYLFCFVLEETCSLHPTNKMDIQKLQKMRNKLCHLKEPTLDTREFDDKLSKLKIIFGRTQQLINDPEFENSLNADMRNFETGPLSATDIVKFYHECNQSREIIANQTMMLGNQERVIETQDEHSAKLDSVLSILGDMHVSRKHDTDIDVPDDKNDNNEADLKNSNIKVICSSTDEAQTTDETNVERDDDSDYPDSDDSFEEICISQGDDTSRSTTSNFKLEDYQLELAENALLGRNTIICAETGSGKTWVAFHIVREHLRKASNSPRKVVFMARTAILVRHQFQRFQKYLPEFKSKLISGEEDECKMLHMFMDGSFDILFFTPQILVNNLDEKTINSLSEFSLLIFDECHHTKGNEPFKRLARKYLTEKKNGQKNLPQVVGLTATIGVGKSKTEAQAEEHILRVCACLDVECLSTVERHTDELKRKTNTIEEETIPLDELSSDPGREIIISAMHETEELLNRKVCMEPDLIDLVVTKQPKDKESQAFNKWTVDVMNEAQRIVDNPNTAREIRTCAKYLNIYNSALEINKLLTSGDVIAYLAGKHKAEIDNYEKLIGAERQLLRNLEEMQTKLMSRGRRSENPNVRILSDALRKMIDKEGEDSRAMVMVKARATCKALAAFLNRDLARVAVRASPLLGQGDRGSEEGMSGKEQEDTLHKFETGEYQILVCTSVGNEGIDIPNCNIVISYEYSGNEVTRIQMKGRARKANAKAIAMGTERILVRDRMNAYKAYMMYRAMEQVKQINPKVMQRRIAVLQKDELHKYNYKVATQTIKQQMKTDGNFKILCQRCSAFVCYLSDVKQLGHDHMVVRKYFDKQIEKYPHKRPKKYDGLHKKFKMRCKNCPLDWGIVAVRDVWELYILKLQNMKFVDLQTLQVETYKHWIDVPCNIEKIGIEDLPYLLGNL